VCSYWKGKDFVNGVLILERKGVITKAAKNLCIISRITNISDNGGGEMKWDDGPRQIGL
jgi:hypothetical protein